MFPIICALCCTLIFLAPAAHCAAPPLILRAQAFGAKGDGVTDDGGAVLKMLDAAAQAHGPALLQFGPRKTYFLKTGRERYVFLLNGVHDLTLDGGGSLFLVDSQQRFLKLTQSRSVTLRNFNVDYVPLPFADGTVIAKDKAAGTLDVHIDAGEAMPPLGGPTREDGEQAFFGALWHRGPYSGQGDGGPYWVRDNFDVQAIRARLGNRVVRIQSEPGQDVFDAIEPGAWRFSVPVRGIAHRVGPGESFQISGNQDFTLENIALWAAPWFAFGINGSTGRVVLRNVSVQPKPGTARSMSSWRDGFHVKNNRASLLFDHCTVQGSGDDAFNIATHTSTVRQVVSPTQITISQNYPLGVAAMEVGDTLVFYSPAQGRLLGQARIAQVAPAHFQGDTAPLFTLALDATIPGMTAGQTLVWNRQSANPDTVLRGCRMDTSCRFRSPVTLDGCHLNALAWFTGDEVESPIPSDVIVKNCFMRLGQGNPSLVMAMDGPFVDGHGPTEPVIFHVLFENNVIWGNFTLSDAQDVRLIDNRFSDPSLAITFHNDRDVILRGNTRGGKPF